MENYKIEAKPIFYHVTLSSGCYSDAVEKHLFFAANSPEEAWMFLKRYIDSTADESEYCWGARNPIVAKWGSEKFISEKYTGDKEDISWGSGYDIAEVEIEMLKVIHFQK